MDESTSLRCPPMPEPVGIHVPSTPTHVRMTMSMVVIVSTVTVMMVVVITFTCFFVEHLLDVIRHRLFVDLTYRFRQRGHELENILC